ncbi:hypothetical protein ACIBCU_20325 [Streptomyces sp. NPDC051064]|uniref:hypothetical protein n=1 Tax=Streptomyces sp. NPDC051064 TaxID=3365641 RepID=UPI00379BE601
MTVGDGADGVVGRRTEAAARVLARAIRAVSLVRERTTQRTTQRTDSTHVLAAVRDLTRLELITAGHLSLDRCGVHQGPVPAQRLRVRTVPAVVQADYLSGQQAEICIGRSRHWGAVWLWFLS